MSCEGSAPPAPADRSADAGWPTNDDDRLAGPDARALDDDVAAQRDACLDAGLGLHASPPEQAPCQREPRSKPARSHRRWRRGCSIRCSRCPDLGRAPELDNVKFDPDSGRIQSLQCLDGAGRPQHTGRWPPDRPRGFPTSGRFFALRSRIRTHSRRRMQSDQAVTCEVWLASSSQCPSRMKIKTNVKAGIPKFRNLPIEGAGIRAR